MKTIIGCGLALSAALCVCGANTPLRSVDQLPVDRFDEYQPDTFPPYPWLPVGKSGDGVEILLKKAANSPFVKNDVTGKGLVLTDTSSTAGKGVGFKIDFRPPPEGKVYLGFDFKFDNPKSGPGVDLVCKLDNRKSGRGLTLHLGKDGNLSLADGALKTLAPLKSGLWYHAAIVLNGDKTDISLLDIKNARTNQYSVFVRNHKKFYKTQQQIAPPDYYDQLSFSSEGPDAGTGAWAIDNICMAGKVDAARDKWYPFDMLSKDKLRACKRKVFSYFYIYSSGWSNQDPGLSWYTRTVLNPTLTKPDRRKGGSEMFCRPLPRPPMQEPKLTKPDQLLKAMEEEVRLGIQQGLDGFYADFHSHPKAAGGVKFFTEKSFILMDAAQRVDPDFKILPCIYSSTKTLGAKGGADKGMDPVTYANSDIIKRIAKHPAALRLPDGRLVMSMWFTEKHSPGWWQKVLEQMKKNGYPAVLVGHFNTNGQLQAFADAKVCYGMAQWGCRHVCDYAWGKYGRKFTDLLIYPVSSQDVRSRGCGLWEAEGSGLLRNLWTLARRDKADWVFMDTWSDYTETPMAPSTYIGFVPYDLNAYYSQWFKTGEQPAIVRDRLYYFYRRNRSDLKPEIGPKWKFRITKAKDEVELLAFLKAPGELKIVIDGKEYKKSAPAGITSFKVPMPKDKQFVPEFSLTRNGKVIASGKGQFTVMNKVEYSHMIYSSGIIAPDDEK